MTTTSIKVRSVSAPPLPTAPKDYNAQYFHNFSQILRVFFNSVSNAINADITSESTVSIAAVPVNGVLDLSGFTNFNVNVQQLTADITTIAFPNVVDDGDDLNLRFQQSNAGGNAVNGWPTNVLLAGGTYTLTATPGQYDILIFHYDADISLWLEISRSQNL